MTSRLYQFPRSRSRIAARDRCSRRCSHTTTRVFAKNAIEMHVAAIKPVRYMGASVCFQIKSGSQACIAYPISFIEAITRARSSVSSVQISWAHLIPDQSEGLTSKENSTYDISSPAMPGKVPIITYRNHLYETGISHTARDMKYIRFRACLGLAVEETEQSKTSSYPRE